MLYLLIYETYVFYKIIPYGCVQVGTEQFNEYIEKYSYFLRDIRYENYSKIQEWNIAHFLRPYNYQLLSFYRLILFLAALPLFQDFKDGCITCLMVIQTL